MMTVDSAEAVVLLVPAMLTLFILSFGALLVLQPEPADKLHKKKQ